MGGILSGFDSIGALLNKMEDEGKVDLSILSDLDSTAKAIESEENRILENGNSEDTSAFLSYHLLRNVRLAIIAMHKRFLIAEETHDNPIVAQESLAVLPILADSTEVALTQLGQPISTGKQDMMIERVRILRRALANASLLTDEETELSSLPKGAVEDEHKSITAFINKKYLDESEDTH